MVPGECNVTTTKATYFGFFIRFNLALGSFGKEGNVLVRISMSPIIIISSSFPDILQKNFLKFFSFVFLFIFLRFFLFLRIYLEYLGKKKTNKQTNEPTKQNKKQLIRFISLALPCGLPHSSLFIYVFFFFFFYLTQSKEGKSLNFLSLLNDVIFSRAHSDLNHKIKVPVRATGRSLLINAKKFRITYLNQMES